MLALSRTEGQSIIIDGIIEVKVVKWSRNSVRLAIQAPREVSVDRDEIWKRIHPGEKSPMEKADLRYSNGSAVAGAASTNHATLESHEPAARLSVPRTNGVGHHPQVPMNGHGQNGSAGAGMEARPG